MIDVKEFMMNPRTRIAAALLAGGLSLVSCATGQETPKAQSQQPVEQSLTGSSPNAPTNQLEVKVQYFPNGTRRITLDNHSPSGLFSLSSIDGFCDAVGGDLIEETELARGNSGVAGNDMVRSVGHPDCADGILTPEDSAPATQGMLPMK